MRSFTKSYKYKFNGIEYQDELGLNLYDMEMRDYDPAIGRWTGIDPITHYDQSPYMAMNGNPITFADPSGADGVGMGGYYLNWAANQAYLNSSLGSSSNWGQSAVGGSSIDFMSNFENSAYSTNDGKEIGSIIGFYARQSGYTGFTYTYADTSNNIHGTGIGFYQYSTKGSGISGKYGGDGSGSLMDYLHKFLYATDQINPIALAWDGIKAKFTGSDRFGNTLTPFESSMKIAGAIPVGTYANVSESVLGHIFRDAVGHVNPSTVTSQMRYFNLFEKVSSNPNNLVPTANAAAEAAGVATYNQTFRNGSTVWVMMKNGKIFNAGVNVP